MNVLLQYHESESIESKRVTAIELLPLKTAPVRLSELAGAVLH